MTVEDIEQIKEIIRASIQPITKKLDDYIESDAEWKEGDKEWKERAEPVIEMGESVQGFGKVSLFIFGFIAAFGGAAIAIMNLFKKK